jgi:AcrR family transcriptional regulator
MQSPSATVKPGTETQSAAVPDRRTRHRDRTRRALAEAAMELFATQGYAATTVGDITDRADVAPRTFFRHFESKEDVLLPLDHDMGAIEAIKSQPSTLGDMEALRSALVSMAPNNEPAIARIRNLRSALSSSAALRGRDFDKRKQTEEDMARALASRRGLIEPDPTARLSAAVGFAVLRVAMDQWLDLPNSTPLAPLIEEEFDRMRRIVAEESREPLGQDGDVSW